MLIYIYSCMYICIYILICMFICIYVLICMHQHANASRDDDIGVFVQWLLIPSMIPSTYIYENHMNNHVCIQVFTYV